MHGSGGHAQSGYSEIKYYCDALIFCTAKPANITLFVDDYSCFNKALGSVMYNLQFNWIIQALTKLFVKHNKKPRLGCFCIQIRAPAVNKLVTFYT